MKVQNREAEEKPEQSRENLLYKTRRSFRATYKARLGGNSLDECRFVFFKWSSGGNISIIFLILSFRANNENNECAGINQTSNGNIKTMEGIGNQDSNCSF